MKYACHTITISSTELFLQLTGLNVELKLEFRKGDILQSQEHYKLNQSTKIGMARSY